MRDIAVDQCSLDSVKLNSTKGKCHEKNNANTSRTNRITCDSRLRRSSRQTKPTSNG